jgi:hypothetical protein
MTVRTIALLNAQSTTATPTFTSPWQSPEMPRDFLDATVVVSVENCTGSPSLAIISPVFQVWHSIVGGNPEEVVDPPGGGTSPVNSWYNLVGNNNPSMLPDGDWPQTWDVSGAVITAPVGLVNTIRGGFPWRLQISWTLTGGTTPALSISAIAYVRERFVGGFDRIESKA